MEREMETVQYGHHEHPLISHESKGTVPHCCSACGLRLLSSPYYSCVVEDCNFYIHPACKQLPDELMHHHLHGVTDVLNGINLEKSLALFSKPRDGNCRCGDCGKLCKNFTYRCSQCEFVLHPLCGSPLDIQIKHISHPQHPLVVMRKEASLLCDVCGTEHKGFFFSCHLCDFWIHQDCASLPTLVRVQNHQHHLSLFYSCADLSHIYFYEPRCLICGEIALTRFGKYYCFACMFIAHVDCAKSHMKDVGVVPHLPTRLYDTFPSLIMRAGVEELAIAQESDSKGMLEKYHPHSLVLTNDIDDTAQESICNACIKPITPPYYHCNAQSHDCNFLLHKFCADLPLSIKHQFLESWPSGLASPRWDGFFYPFYCYRCHRYSNGFGYKCPGGDVDIDCAMAPIIIKHDSHEQHPLILIDNPLRGHKTCCDKISSYWYLCTVCMFTIHIDCARLPNTVTHKFDQHPLTLTFGSSSDSSTHHLCEICEEDMDPKHWFYHCTQCDQSFHVMCIPSTGKYSGVKFGGTMKVACHTDHPMTLVRTIDVCSQTCGHCRKIIQGFEDGTALHCADCDFWLHLDCGYTSSGVRDYHYLKRFL